MSNPSESELFNKMFINFQQVCYILKFKNNQELYICITSLANELKKNFQEFCTLFQNFSLRSTFKFLQKERYRNVWLHYKQKDQFSQWKIRQFLASKTKHTDDFLYLNTEHTESFLHSEPNIPNLAKPNILKLSYFLDRTYRQFLSFETDHIEQTEHADNFLRRKPNKPNISCVVFVRSFQLGKRYSDQSKILLWILSWFWSAHNYYHKISSLINITVKQFSA